VSGAFESAIPFAKVVVVETELGGFVLTGDAVGIGVGLGVAPVPGDVMIGELVEAPLHAASAAQAMPARTPVRRVFKRILDS